MKPICVPCRRFFRPKKNAVSFIEGMPETNDVAALMGNRAADQWKPYKLWNGDLWACPDCGAEIIVGVGIWPLAEYFQEDFDKKCESWNATIQINDC